MAVVEGIGDEVVCVLAVLTAVILISIAWISTRVGEAGTLISVIILDRERFSNLLQRARDRVGSLSSPTTDERGESSTGDSVSSLNSDSSVSQQPALSDLQNIGQERVESLPLRRQHEVQESSEHEVNASSHIHHLQSHKESNNDCRSVSDTHPDLSAISEDGKTENTCKVDEQSSCECTADNLNRSKAYDTVPECESLVEESAALTPTESSTQSETNESHGVDDESIHITERVDETPDDHVRIKLQFIDGLQKMVASDPNITIGTFKRTHFATQLADRSVVRLIVNGQELRDDSLTLSAYSITSGSVIHCLVTRHSSSLQQTSHHETRNSVSQFDIGVLMFPLFGAVLILLWYARIMYRAFFNAASTFSLLAISFFYIIALLASLRNAQQAGHRHVD